MKTCKTCSFWGAYRDNVCDAPESDFIKSTVPGFPPQTTRTTKDPAGFHIFSRADDDSGLEAYLITGPDFGCTKHSPKT